MWCSSNSSNRQKICRLGDIRSVSYARCNHAVIQFRTYRPSTNTGRGFNFSYAFQPILLDVRLNYTTSSDSREGRLEINYNGTWGTVCYRGFTNASARVACASLGFGYVGTVTQNSHGRGSGPIWFDEVSCIGTEQRIDECSHGAWGSHNCSHSDDVSINCGCGNTEYNDARGFISSPGFPIAHGGNFNCTYYIKRSDQDSVIIMFPVFYIYDPDAEYYGPAYQPCLEYDWLEVQCADEWHKPNIRRYCGYKRPPALEFKSCDHVILRFNINIEKFGSAFQITYGFKPATPEVEIFAYSGMMNRSDIRQSVTCPGSSRQCNASRRICSSNSNLCCEIYNRSTSDEYCMCQIGYGGRSCAQSNRETNLLHFEVIEKPSAAPWILLSVFAVLVGISFFTVISVMIYKSCKSKEDPGDDPQTIQLKAHHTQPNEAEREEGGGYEHIQHSSSSQTQPNEAEREEGGGYEHIQHSSSSQTQGNYYESIG